MTKKATIYLKDYQMPDFLIESVELDFLLGEENTRVRGTLSIKRNGCHSRPLVLDGEALSLRGIMLDNQPLDPGAYTLSGDKLILETNLERFVVQTEAIIHPQDNTTLSGLYCSGGNFCTQCEAEGFRRITYSLDRPDVLARYKTTITADKKKFPVLLSNGNLIDSRDLDDGMHRVVWADPFPKPSYLFALVAGDLAHIKDTFTTRSGRAVELYIYTQHHNVDKCDHAMVSLKKAMAWDEEVYGREYDLDLYMIVAVDDFNMGAMENKGLNIFNSRYVLARQETATDADYNAIEGVIAHEYFHNWSGNRVTCRDWFQLSLKEGFTVFRDQEFSADMGSRGVQRIKDVNVMRVHQFVEDSGPMSHPVRPQSYQEINNFYTVTVYNKGAEVVRMLHHLVGAEGFRRGTDHYFETFDGQAVTTDDFVAVMEKQNGIDLSQFKRWYDQAGTPVLELTPSYDEPTGTYTLQVDQSCPPTPGQKRKQAFHIPLAVALLDENGDCMELGTQGKRQSVLSVTKESERFVFENIRTRPVLSALRGFSAPVKVEIDYTEDELYFLMVKDNDPFARWEATQRLSTSIVLELVEAVQCKQELRIDERYLSAVRSLLESEQGDLALLSQLLRLPSETYISEFLDVIDPDAVYLACTHLRTALGQSLWIQLLNVYHRYDGKPYEATPESMAGRSLKNTCLDYLSATGTGEAKALAVNQFETAHNMTDMIASMAALNDSPGNERWLVLEKFYTKWKHDPLVVDKWLGLQAISRLPDTLDHVIELTRHESFNLSNPNRFRALIGSFAHGNNVQFHQRTGRGYKFIADYVTRVDHTNPQLAARLATVFNTWRRYDDVRRQLIRTELEDILKQPKLSNDVEEIVTKALL